MRTLMDRAGLVVALAILAWGGAAAQEPSTVQVSEVGAPWYFAVMVEDVDASVAWYCRNLDLKELDGSRADDGSWRIVNLGSDRLAVEIIRDDRAEAAERARGFFKVGFRVPDVAAVADRVERSTGERPRVVDFEEHGVQILQLEDPDGNRIQLTSAIDPD